jgi:hypothetical protein
MAPRVVGRMIKKVTAHHQDLATGDWHVRLMCGHVLRLDAEDHSRKVKARFCAFCPGADLALSADARNAAAREFIARQAVEASLSAQVAASLEDTCEPA